MKRRIRMKDLADELNISVVSVSKALSDKEGISKELKDKVKEKAEEMGYVVDMRAKSMKSGEGFYVGILIPEYFWSKGNSFYSEIFRHMAVNLYEKGCYPILYVVTKDEIAKKKIPSFCSDVGLKGLIILGEIEKEYIQELNKTGINIVLSDFYENIEGISTVENNNYISGFELASYLHKRGHKKIGFVGTIEATSNILDRYLGCQKFCIENGLDDISKYIVRDRDDKTIIIKNFILPKELPTSFVCNCDEVAFYFIKFLHRNNIRVPEDISVVAYDNTIYSEISEPSISSYETDIINLAKKTISKILEVNRTIERSFVEGKIIERNSVK